MKLQTTLFVVLSATLFSNPVFASGDDYKALYCPADSIKPNALANLIDHLTTQIGEDVHTPFSTMYHCSKNDVDTVELVFEPHEELARYQIHRELTCKSRDSGSTWSCPAIEKRVFLTLEKLRVEVENNIAPTEALEIADYILGVEMSAFDLVGELKRSEFKLENAKRLERISKNGQYYVVKTRIDIWSGYRLWIKRIDCGAENCDLVITRVVPWRKMTD